MICPIHDYHDEEYVCKIAHRALCDLLPGLTERAVDCMAMVRARVTDVAMCQSYTSIGIDVLARRIVFGLQGSRE